MKEKIRKFLIRYLMTTDERFIYLQYQYQQMHKIYAKSENYVGHTSDCCDKDIK